MGSGEGKMGKGSEEGMVGVGGVGVGWWSKQKDRATGADKQESGQPGGQARGVEKEIGGKSERGGEVGKGSWEEDKSNL